MDKFTIITSDKKRLLIRKNDTLPQLLVSPSEQIYNLRLAIARIYNPKKPLNNLISTQMNTITYKNRITNPSNKQKSDYKFNLTELKVKS